MTIQVRLSKDRGYFDYGWLKTYHTFSFARYDDPAYRGFRALRVINEDRIRPGVGFPLHSHQDMEIFSIVLEGGLTHQDDLGNGSILRPGQIQLLSAGTGVTHSELNASDQEEAHFLQIWILPQTRQLKPTYQESFFPFSNRQNKWKLILSSDGREGSLHIQQDVNVYLAYLDKDKELTYHLDTQRYGWLQVIKGEVHINDSVLNTGDGAAISDVSNLHVKAFSDTELIFFDLS